MKGRNTCIKILLLFVSLAVAVAQERVDIDTLDQFVAVGEYMDTRCKPFENFADIDCKDLPASPGTTGFWSTCANGNCELKIRVGNVVSDIPVPIRIEVLSYVAGINALIRVRSKIIPTGGYRNLLDIENTGGWVISQVPLDPALGYTVDSEIYVRLESGPATSDVDILDKITFVYTEPPPTTTTTTTTTTTAPTTTTTTAPTTTTTTPPTTTTTTAPTTTTTTLPTTTTTPLPTTTTTTLPTTTTTLPTTTTTTTLPTTTTTTTTTRAPPPIEDIWDGVAPSVGWEIDGCEFHNSIDDFPPEGCLMNVNVGSRTGFLSSCGRPCTMTSKGGEVTVRAFEGPPTSVTINSYVSGTARIEVTVMVGGVSKDVGTIQETFWSDTIFSLLGLGLDENSEILFKPYATDYPYNVDLIDKVTVRFSDPPATTTTTQPTTTTTTEPTTKERTTTTQLSSTQSTITPPITTSRLPPVGEPSNDDDLLLILILVAVGVLIIIVLAWIGYYCFKRQQKQRHRRFSATSEDTFDERQNAKSDYRSTPAKSPENYAIGKSAGDLNATPYARNPYGAPQSPYRNNYAPGSEVQLFPRLVRQQ